MIDAANYDQPETLKDGTVVTVRAVRPDDKRRIVDAFQKLDTQSVFTRFFHHKQDLSAAELKDATEVDFDEVVALVVTAGKGKKERIIAGARYLLYESVADDERHAEVAFLVLERYQGHGIAGRLLRHLARIGRDKGVACFEAEVLAENRPMLSVFSRSRLPMTRRSEDGSVHVSLDLTG